MKTQTWHAERKTSTSANTWNYFGIKLHWVVPVFAWLSWRCSKSIWLTGAHLHAQPAWDSECQKRVEFALVLLLITDILKRRISPMVSVSGRWMKVLLPSPPSSGGCYACSGAQAEDFLLLLPVREVTAMSCGHWPCTEGDAFGVGLFPSAPSVETSWWGMESIPWLSFFL